MLTPFLYKNMVGGWLCSGSIRWYKQNLLGPNVQNIVYLDLRIIVDAWNVRMKKLYLQKFKGKRMQHVLTPVEMDLIQGI